MRAPERKATRRCKKKGIERIAAERAVQSSTRCDFVRVTLTLPSDISILYLIYYVSKVSFHEATIV
jgi:hypothetical protein